MKEWFHQFPKFSLNYAIHGQSLHGFPRKRQRPMMGLPWRRGRKLNQLRWEKLERLEAGQPMISLFLLAYVELHYII
jgi:hypothetical protein